jgi:hypothetical protein
MSATPSKQTATLQVRGAARRFIAQRPATGGSGLDRSVRRMSREAKKFHFSRNVLIVRRPTRPNKMRRVNPLALQGGIEATIL